MEMWNWPKLKFHFKFMFVKEISNDHQLFDGRTVLIATMHKKEAIIAPLLEKELSVKCMTTSELNTDHFGTFSGEIARHYPPLQTVRMKALAALQLHNETLVVASEGSFGPHPSSPFIAANEEFVILLDTLNGFEIVGRHFTVETNFRQQDIKSLKELEAFKKNIGYPAHGIILKIKDFNDKNSIHKDFTSINELNSHVSAALDKGFSISAETDMRAMYNPTRMLAIEQAVIDLVKNIKSPCPKCKAPGFVIREVNTGLPCTLCHLPTKSAKGFIYRCQKCDYSEVRLTEGISFEDPTYCDFCNP
jgi:hypothetical protein